MSDDNVARLRLYAQKQRETKSLVLGLLLSEAADEIERLRARWRDGDGLVSRLRELERDLLKHERDLSDSHDVAVIGEAADEIERLRERLSRMEAK